MSIFLDWSDIEDDAARLEACARYQLEIDEIKGERGAHVEALWLKQSIIRIYAADNKKHKH